MATRHQLHRLTSGRIGRHRTVMVAVQAHDLGQHVRVTGIAFRTRGRVPFPVAGRGHRIDREHLIASRDQSSHPRATLGLDTNLHPRGGLRRFELGPVSRHHRGNQRMQPAHPIQPLGQAPPCQAPPRSVDDLDVMMIFGPVITDKQHRSSSHPNRQVSSAEETAGDLMVQVLT